jgi:tetratricopeptide (TPR) repeat protein
MKRIKNGLAMLLMLLFSSALFAQKSSVEPPFSKTSQETQSLFDEGLKLYDQGDFRMARKLFLQATEKDPSFTTGLLYLANTSRDGKEYADAVAKAQAAAAKGSEWDKMLLELISTGLTDDYTKRLAIAQKMTAKFPNVARAYIELGNAYSAGNETEKAREAFMKATKLAPNNVAAFYLLASSYVFDMPKDFRLAEKFAHKAVKLAPTSASAEILLGDVYRAQSNLEKARDAYTAAIALQKEEPAAYYKRGHANTYLGNFEDARNDYGEAGKHDDVNAFASQNIAYTYLYDNDTKKALQALSDEETRMSGKDGYTNQNRLNILSSAAFIALHNNDAATLYTLINKIEPVAMQIGNDLGTSESKATLKAQVLFWQAALQALQGNYASAEQTADEMKTSLASINNPRKLEGHSLLMGLIHFKQNKFDQAVYDLQKADRNNVYDKYWLARAYEAAGSKEKAADVYKEIADNNFNSVGYALIRNEVKRKVQQ